MPRRDWAAYYAKTQSRPPRETVLRALDGFDRDGLPETARLAVDLGCGGGRDLPALLDRGWRVIAIDREPAAEEGIRSREDLSPEALAQVTFRQVDFADPDFALPEVPFVTSSFALFNCPLARFPVVWKKIDGAIRPGGRFAGHLLGPKDTWAQPGDRFRDLVYLDRAAVDGILAGYDVEWLWEEEDDSVTPRGEAKHWHIWHIVARKKTD